MVTPLAIATAPTKMPIKGVTFRKGALVAVRMTLEVGVLTHPSDSATLY